MINEYYKKTMAIRARAEEFNVNCSASGWKQKSKVFAKEDFFFGLFPAPSRDQDLELLFDMAMSDYQPLCLGYGESWSLVKFTLSEEIVE